MNNTLRWVVTFGRFWRVEHGLDMLTEEGILEEMVYESLAPRGEMLDERLTMSCHVPPIIASGAWTRRVNLVGDTRRGGLPTENSATLCTSGDIFCMPIDGRIDCCGDVSSWTVQRLAPVMPQV